LTIVADAGCASLTLCLRAARIAAEADTSLGAAAIAAAWRAHFEAIGFGRSYRRVLAGRVGEDR
jgi:hypothetical protein